MKNISKTAAQPAGIDTPLPVLDIVNNIISITNYLSAVQSAQLPDAIVNDPSYDIIVTDYSDWQYVLWEQFFEGLVNGDIMAQAQEINNLLTDGITEQNIFIGVITPPPASTPSVILNCDAVSNQINAGLTFVQQLQGIADQIKNADQAKIDQLNAIISVLNAQFNKMEQELTDEALDNSKEAVVTVIKIGVAVATEEDPIEPLVEGIAQIGIDIIKELVLSSEINETLSQLEDAWNKLDEDTILLAQMNLIISRLNTIMDDTSETLNALNNIVNDWQIIANVINDSPASWASTGIQQVTEWANRMSRVSFYTGINQVVG